MLEKEVANAAALERARDNAHLAVPGMHETATASIDLAREAGEVIDGIHNGATAVVNVVERFSGLLQR